jgi:predicted CopG family antitoxin
VHLVHQIPFICERATITLAELNTVAAITESSPSSSSERRRRLRLKRIVVSEHNYFALKRLGQAGDSFNDVISKLIRIHRIHEQKQQREGNDENNRAIIGEDPFPDIFSELFDEQDRKQFDDLLGYRRKINRNNQTNKQEGNNDPIDERYSIND